jgi:hypothetical protein
VSGYLAGARRGADQSAVRPVTEDGLPLIGAVSGVDGAYVATGHSVWGMLNAPATGEAMSELILDGAAHRVDLALFAPGACRRLTRRVCAAPQTHGCHPPIEHLPAPERIARSTEVPRRVAPSRIAGRRHGLGSPSTPVACRASRRTGSQLASFRS